MFLGSCETIPKLDSVNLMLVNGSAGMIDQGNGALGDFNCSFDLGNR